MHPIQMVDGRTRYSMKLQVFRLEIVQAFNDAHATHLIKHSHYHYLASDIRNVRIFGELLRARC